MSVPPRVAQLALVRPPAMPVSTPDCLFVISVRLRMVLPFIVVTVIAIPVTIIVVIVIEIPIAHERIMCVSSVDGF